MLTSSDAKWRCMWHMLVWSILLTLVSQFLTLTDHIAFYIFASMCMLVLPVITAIYSNTSGRRGSGLIRVSYVICDPVLACISLTPVLLLNHLPGIVDHNSCIQQYDSWNATCLCIVNLTGSAGFARCENVEALTAADKLVISKELSGRFVVIQMAVAMPILLSLLMGRRTSKMSFNTYLLTFAYWFVIAIESVDMLEAIRLGDLYHRVIYTTMAIVTITMIITNSYAIVTLCSFISPSTAFGSKRIEKQFDFIYRIFVGCSGILFAEIPLLVARFQMVTVDISRILPATFYLWFIKDCIFICLIISIILAQTLRKRYQIKFPCRMQFDNPDVVFQPEKRDAYIERKKRVTFQDPPATTFGEDSQRKIVATPKASALPPDVKKKQPASVLKNGSSSQLSVLNNNCKDYGTKEFGKKFSNIEASNSGTPLVKYTDGMLCLPLTDHPSSSTGSPRVTGGARPKVYDTVINYGLHRDIEAAVESNSDSDSATVL